jgi:hypothetical protein
MDRKNSSRTAEYMALFRAVETVEPSGRRLFEDLLAAPLLSGKLKALALLARVPLVSPVPEIRGIWLRPKWAAGKAVEAQLVIPFRHQGECLLV